MGPNDAIRAFKKWVWKRISNFTWCFTVASLPSRWFKEWIYFFERDISRFKDVSPIFLSETGPRSSTGESNLHDGTTSTDGLQPRPCVRNTNPASSFVDANITYHPHFLLLSINLHLSPIHQRFFRTPKRSLFMAIILTMLYHDLYRR